MSPIHTGISDAVHDLERNGQLVRVNSEIDPKLEIADIQRRLCSARAPAVLFEHVKGSSFPVLANLFGTADRARFLFRHTLETVKTLVRAKADPRELLQHPGQWLGLPLAGLHALPRKSLDAPVTKCQARLSDLPQITGWPKDGGPFITLPQVCTLDPRSPSILKSNLGMYRVQLAGSQYVPDEQCGLHYQIHRGIGVHHHAARELGKPLKVSVFVGGPPAHTLAAVMPLPEGMSELSFAGLLAGRSFRYHVQDGWVVSNDADFCILGEVGDGLLPEGPFGDHLGYYSGQHPFPWLRVHAVMHRQGAVWPFTSVGRPPQEDSVFGELIHEIAGPMVKVSVPGVKALHAVDSAGVHPLLLALGSERYVPYGEREPMELLTQANGLLGFNQVSLAKYLFIAAHEDAPGLRVDQVAEFLGHVLERVDLQRDLHFQTCTTMDTLDYSGQSLNHGSKLVVACAGAKRRELGRDEAAMTTLQLPVCFSAPRMALPGVLALQGPHWASQGQAEADMLRLCAMLGEWPGRNAWPLVTVVDDSAFCARSLANWLWVTFTRSNPSHDVHGVGAAVEHKHWGCKAPLVIDARSKAHHAEALEQDPETTRRVDAMFAKGGELHGLERT